MSYSILDDVKYCSVQCDCTDDAVALLQLFKSEKVSNFVFRGHRDCEWRLESTLERCVGVQPDIKLEHHAINFFRDECKTKKLSYGRGGKGIDILGTMQHYGAPTRLLDFTVDPFVALLFAFHDEKDDRKDRVVWILNWKLAIEKSRPVMDSLNETVSKLSLDPAYQLTIASDGETPFDPIEEYLEYIKDSGLVAGKEYSERFREIAEGYLSKEYEGGILPLLWEDYENNPNMFAQKGVFLMPLNFDGIERNIETMFGIRMNCPRVLSMQEFLDNFQDYHFDQLCLIKVQMKNSLRSEILGMLEMKHHMTYDSLFPSLEQVARRVKYK